MKLFTLNNLFEYFLNAVSCFFASVAVGAGGGGAGGDGGSGSAVITTGGEGGSDGGDGSSSTDGGKAAGGAGESHVDTGAGATDDDFGSFDDAEFDSARASGGGTDYEADDFGPKTYQDLKTALKSQPELFKSVKKGLSMLKRFSEHFESPEAAGEMLGKIAEFGGIEGIEAELGETATFLQAWNAGDKEVLSKWLEDNGDGLSASMPAVYDMWADKDKKGWARVVARTFVQTLNSAPVGGISTLAAINALGAMKDVKNVAETAEFQRIVEAINAIQGQADSEPEKKSAPDDAAKNANAKREQQLQERENNLRKQGLAGQAKPILARTARAALKVVLGDRKLTSDKMEQLISDVHSEFAKIVMQQDAAGKANRQRLLAAGQDAEWIKATEKVANKFMTTAARKVWRRYTGITGLTEQQRGERRAEGQSRREVGSGASQDTLKTKTPDANNIDWTAMRSMFGGRNEAEDAFNGWLKTGKYAGKRVWIMKGDPKTVYLR